MSAYTPGPWEADGVIVNAEESTVAMCADRYEALTDEHLANARLIATAPELFALLVESQETIGRSWRARRDAAIAKARGKA